VDLTCSADGPVVSALEAGEWLTYTIGVSQTGTYVVEVRYRASADGAKLSVTSDGAERTEPATLVDTSGLWSTSRVATLELRAGAQALRLFVDASTDGFEVASIVLLAP
jgi:hypothetical protein